MKKFLLIIVLVIIATGCNKKDENKDINSNFNSNNDVNTSNSNSNDNNAASENEGKYTVNLYLFHSETCSHCQEEIAWLNSIKSDYEYLKIHYYEVSEYNDLYQKIVKAYNITSTGVPLTIIGNDYYIGFSSSKERKFIRAIKDISEEEQCDIVAAVINNEDYSSCVK